MVSCTSARPSGGRPDVPAKMTSSILPPRRLLAPCSPITHASASTTLDLPDPLGPTMQVMPGSSCSVVEDAKDLNPLRVRLFRYKTQAPHRVTRWPLKTGEAQRGSPYDTRSRQHPLRAGVPRHHAGAMRSTMIAMVTLAALVAPAPGAAAQAPDDPVTRAHLLTRADYDAVYPDMRDPSRIVLRSPVFAPRGCEDRGQVVRGSSRILGSVSPGVRRRSVSLIDQNVVRFVSRSEARSLVQRYRHFSRHCVRNVATDDGEGGDVTLKNRAWLPPRVGEESAGMLVGWVQNGSTDWRRVLVARVGRTVSVLDVSYTDVRPPREGVVALGELAVGRLGRTTPTRSPARRS